MFKKIGLFPCRWGDLTKCVDNFLLVSHARFTIHDMNVKVRRRFDVRILIGIFLVVVSAAVGAMIFSSATQTLPMYVATKTLSPGQKITEKDVRVADVQLGDTAQNYLQYGELEPQSVAQNLIGVGEFIPKDSMTTQTNLKNTRVVVVVTSELSTEIQPGSFVEIWASMETENGIYSTPSVLVQKSQVVHVNEDGGFALSAGQRSVEVIVPRNKIASVLEAQANGDVISLLPVGAQVP